MKQDDDKIVDDFIADLLSEWNNPNKPAVRLSASGLPVATIDDFIKKGMSAEKAIEALAQEKEIRIKSRNYSSGKRISSRKINNDNYHRLNNAQLKYEKNVMMRKRFKRIEVYNTVRQRDRALADLAKIEPINKETK